MQGQEKGRKGYCRDVHILYLTPAANRSEFMTLMRAVTEGTERKKRHCPAHDTRE